MESTPGLTFLPPPPPDPNPNPRISPAYNHRTATVSTTVPTHYPDINTTLSTLKHLIHLSKTTIHSLSNILPATTTATTTTTTTATCPYNSNHRVPPTSLFRHYHQCPSSPAPIDLTLLESLHYPSSLQSPLINLKNNRRSQTQTQTLLHDGHTDLCISLDDYHTSLDSNFFYRDCPAVVTFPQHNEIASRMLNLPSVLSAECADFTGDGGGDVTDAIDGEVIKLLPSEYYNVRTEINQWNDYPSAYSNSVLRSIACSYIHHKEHLMEWILVNSPFYGVVIDVYMRDHILLLFRLCFKAIAREATGFLVSVSKEGSTGGRNCFNCPVLIRVLMWLASQIGILYGETNGKLFTINMFKQSLMNVSSKSLIFYDDSSGLSCFNGETAPVNGSKEIDGGRKGVILVSQVAAAVAALHERFAFEIRIKGIRASRFLPVYQRVQEHEYISKKADEERKNRSNYKPIIEHDGVLWHRGDNQDSSKNKSKEELLAEERDYKRRRMSYRGKKMKRSTTQVTRDIIDEYMEEIKHANMANLASATSSTSNLNAHKRTHNAIEQKTVGKELVSDTGMRSARYEDEVKDKHSKHRHKDYRSSSTKKGYSSTRSDRHTSKRKDERSASVLQNEFDDRYDPSESH